MCSPRSCSRGAVRSQRWWSASAASTLCDFLRTFCTLSARLPLTIAHSWVTYGSLLAHLFFQGPTGSPVIERYRRLCSVVHTSAWRWPYWTTPTHVPQLDEGYHFVDHGAVVSHEPPCQQPTAPAPQRQASVRPLASTTDPRLKLTTRSGVD